MNNNWNVVGNGEVGGMHNEPPKCSPFLGGGERVMAHASLRRVHEHLFAAQCFMLNERAIGVEGGLQVPTSQMDDFPGQL